jgi:hypothetical protein
MVRKKDFRRLHAMIGLSMAAVVTFVFFAALMGVQPEPLLFIPELVGKEISLLGLVMGLMFTIFGVILYDQVRKR